MSRSTTHAEPAATTFSHDGTADDRGRTADSPAQIPAEGWKDVLIRVKDAAKRHHVMLLSAGVAFFGLLALVPALVAMLSLYGLVADPDRIDDQLLDALSAAPAEVRDLIGQQVRDIGDASSGALVAVVGGILLALWSASSGMKNLIEAINQAYDEDESRGFVTLRGLSLAFTIGALVFLLIAFTAIALLPSLLASSSLGSAGRILIGVARFVVLFFGLLAGLAVLYRFAPDRAAARWSWVTPGALFASVLWIVGSLLFSIYAANFGSYNETYGVLGAVVVLMLWLLLTALAIILGAELNSELERQTASDTTAGDARPLGQRGAHAADTVAPATDGD